MSSTPTLSQTERLILANQFRIRAKLEPSEAEALERFAEALMNGYEWEYDDIFQNVDDPFPEDECRFVWDVLHMHESLQSSLEKVAAPSVVSPSEVVYDGYDGNNETRYMGYSRYVVEQKGRFDYIKMTGHNSHMPNVGRYRRMLSAWRTAVGGPGQKRFHDLPEAEIRKILDA